MVYEIAGGSGRSPLASGVGTKRRGTGRVNDECKFSFWYIEVFAYYVYGDVYLCHSVKTDLKFFTLFWIVVAA